MLKLSTYQRIEILLDRSTFEEINVSNLLSQIKKESTITGYGYIKGRRVFVIATDITEFHGSIGQKSVEKINRILGLALQNKTPVITLFESVGARIQEGVVAMHHIGLMFKKFAELSGVLPTIAIQFGINSGATAYCSALMDFTIMVEEKSFSFITGPKVVEKMIGEKISMDELGGTVVHGTITGLASIIASNEFEAITNAKQLLEYLPQHFEQTLKSIDRTIKKKSKLEDVILNKVVSEDSKKGYDMMEIISGIVDDDSFFEINKAYAQNLIVGFAKLGTTTIGIIANQPIFLAGVLDVKSSKKLFRFVQICDAYSIPVLFIADSPGFMPGKEQEYEGIINHGAKVLSVLSTSTVPKITLIVNKIIGGAYGGMSAKSMGSDIVYAWPTAKISIVGDKAAVRILHQKIKKTNDIENNNKKVANDFIEEHLTPYPAAQHGQVDAIILPSETRRMVLNAFYMLENKVINMPKKQRSILPF